MTKASLNGFVDYVTASTVSGWAWDSGKPNDPVVVDVSRNGQSIATEAVRPWRLPGRAE
jgi:hypothetical protein